MKLNVKYSQRDHDELHYIGTICWNRCSRINPYIFQISIRAILGRNIPHQVTHSFKSAFKCDLKLNFNKIITIVMILCYFVLLCAIICALIIL